MAFESKRVQFTKDESCDFNTILKKRVNAYFASEKCSSRANFFMKAKSLFMLAVFASTYCFLLSSVTSGAAVFLIYVFMGFLVATSAMNIAHDALHGAYLNRPETNRALGYVMDLFGASSFYWKKEHTVDHHTFTNIADHDADLDVPFLLRLCPQASHRPFHRFQHWYAPFLYSLNLLHWVYVSDIKRIYKIFTNQFTGPLKPSNRETFLLCFFKVVHVTLFLILPLLILPVSGWTVVLSYIAFLSTTGLVMTLIFQLAHIVEQVAFPLPNEEGKIDNSFLKHQLATTSNFAIKSKLICFLFGGLNFQIEHHLFPHVCHAHLHRLAPIVQKTAQEFGLPYYECPTFFGAIASHFRTLKKLGAGAVEPKEKKKSTSKKPKAKSPRKRVPRKIGKGKKRNTEGDALIS